jgi:hypothetical protein
MSPPRIRYVEEGLRGAKNLYIRMPPGMYRLAKARAALSRGRGIVRVMLRPRHLVALKQALGKRPTKHMLRFPPGGF